MFIRGHYLSCWILNLWVRIQRWAYQLRWPHYCRLCDGTGGVERYERDVGYIFCPCEELDDGVCHRCGEQALDDDYECAACGHRAGDVGAPALDAATCWGECEYLHEKAACTARRTGKG